MRKIYKISGLILLVVIISVIAIVVIKSKKNKSGSGEDLGRIVMNLENLDYCDIGDMKGYDMSECESLSGKVETDKTITGLYYEVLDKGGRVLKHEDIDVSKEWVIDSVPLLVPGSYVKVCATLSGGGVITHEEWFHNDSFSRLEGLDIDMSDADNDGIETYLELVAGTDPNNADTDGDGLNDYIELIEIGTDPLKVDSNGDGKPDGDDDADEDGLTNIEEARLGTYTWGLFTDEDLLTDYDEVKIYGTDPLNRDTDGDGKDDDWEVDNGYNPLVADNAFITTVSAAGKGTVVSVKVKADPGELSNLKVSAVEFRPEIPGYMGDGYELVMNGSFDSAEVTYYFDSANLVMNGFAPRVYRLDVEEDELYPLDTVWDHENAYVTATLDRPAIFVILNSAIFEGSGY